MKKAKRIFIGLVLFIALGAGVLGGCTSLQEKAEGSDTAATTPGLEPVAAEKEAVRVGSLKGPTSMGLLFLMEKAGNEEGENAYTFQMAAAADELLPLMVRGELDIALVPANVAAVLYQQTEGGISVIDINTLGVLYMVSGDASVENISDLKGRRIYLTGKGTTPDYALQFLLNENGMTVQDCELEYRSEAAEVAALLQENPDDIGLLPQPFATAACEQNPALKVVLDLNREWDKVQGENGSSLVTGVTIVRDEFLDEHEDAVAAFLKEHEESASSINQDIEKGAVLAVEQGIVANENIAEKAIPRCNITYMDGLEMKQALSGYLEVLFSQSPESVGGELPDDDFYYVR